MAFLLTHISEFLITKIAGEENAALWPQARICNYLNNLLLNYIVIDLRFFFLLFVQPCHQNLTGMSCIRPVIVNNSCGHDQILPCSVASVGPTVQLCTQLGDLELPCGHVKKLPCHQKYAICEEKCNRTLLCGHKYEKILKL